MEKMVKTLVLGVGNILLTDEGAGIHVIRHLEATCGDLPNVSFVDGGTLSFTLAETIASHQQLIVVDAARGGGSPGEVYCFEGEGMDRYLRGNRQSVHEVGLGDLLDISLLSGHLPQRRALVGIEPLNLDWGEHPSAPVAAAIPRAADRVLGLLRRWDGAETPTA